MGEREQPLNQFCLCCVRGSARAIRSQTNSDQLSDSETSISSTIQTDVIGFAGERRV